MPYITKAFGSSTVPIESETTLTFTIVNDSEDNLTGLAFTDDLPVGMTVANPNGFENISGVDDSNVEAFTGASSIVVSGLDLAAGITASFRVSVVVTTAGGYHNETSKLSTDQTGDIDDSEAIASVTALRSGNDPLWELYRFDAKIRDEEEA